MGFEKLSELSMTTGPQSRKTTFLEGPECHRAKIVAPGASNAFSADFIGHARPGHYVAALKRAITVKNDEKVSVRHNSGRVVLCWRQRC
jgi:hypothetical protein